MLRVPKPHVVLTAFRSAITYHAHFWIERLTLDEEATNRVGTGIYYSFRRHGISIRSRSQVQYEAEMAPSAPTDEMRRDRSGCWRRRTCSGCSANGRHALTASASSRLFGDGETIVAQADPGESAYVIAEGRARVSLDRGDTEVAVLSAGQYFGEMSLLTGEARTATVRARGDARCSRSPQRIPAADPAEPCDDRSHRRSVAERRAGLARARASAAPIAHESASSFVSRIRKSSRLVAIPFAIAPWS